MTARGYKLMYRFIEKAAMANNTHRMHSDFKEKKDRLITLLECLVFDKKVTEQQLADFINSIKASKTEFTGISFDKPFIIK